MFLWATLVTLASCSSFFFFFFFWVWWCGVVVVGCEGVLGSFVTWTAVSVVGYVLIFFFLKAWLGQIGYWLFGSAVVDLVMAASVLSYVVSGYGCGSVIVTLLLKTYMLPASWLVIGIYCCCSLRSLCVVMVLGYVQLLVGIGWVSFFFFFFFFFVILASLLVMVGVMSECGSVNFFIVAGSVGSFLFFLGSIGHGLLGVTYIMVMVVVGVLVVVVVGWCVGIFFFFYVVTLKGAVLCVVFWGCFVVWVGFACFWYGMAKCVLAADCVMAFFFFFFFFVALLAPLWMYRCLLFLMFTLGVLHYAVIVISASLFVGGCVVVVFF
nr:NADH dehydrogenase subunit 2 [Namystynia karyoxenos]